ncbi:MAG: VWA domain-containing protein [Desulfuromusa sp.]|nr:VWA domain-containing protein [Desulfuromusa sp.]
MRFKLVFKYMTLLPAVVVLFSFSAAPAMAVSTCGDVPIYTNSLVDPAILILMDVSGSMARSAPLNDPQTPDLTEIVQKIVNRSGWSSGNAMVFFINGSGHRTAVSYDGSRSAAPLLHVEYAGGESETRIDQGTDDAEEASDGSISLISPDLELTYDGTNQIVGLRFRSVALPEGATITNAYIKLTVDEAQNETTNLVIQGEAADNPQTFTTDPGNISGRTRSTAQVEWPDVEEWSVDSRINIGKEVIGDLIKDDGLSWGFGSWSEGSPGYEGDDPTGTTSVSTGGGNYTVPAYPSGSEYYTRIQVGTAFHDATHQQDLQDAIDSLVPGGGTPLGPSMLAAKDYFSGDRADEVGSGSVYVDLGCQPKILINITDGIGYLPHTSADYMEAYTHILADEDISAVGVGFGLTMPLNCNDWRLSAMPGEMPIKVITSIPFMMKLPVLGNLLWPAARAS